MNELVFIGIFTGLTLSAPIGTSNILCIQHSLSLGWKTGFVAGMGAAFADWVFAILTLWGFVQFTDYTDLSGAGWTFFGGAFLLVLGAWSFFQPVQMIQNQQKKFHHLKNFMTSFVATASNPLTMLGIASSLAISVHLGIAESFSLENSVLFMTGMVIGSVAWWFGLSKTVSLCAGYFSTQRLQKVNKVMSLLIMASGVFLVCLYFA